MQFAWKSDQIAAGETPFGVVGACVVSAQAVAAGVGSLPDPVTQIDADVWRLFQPLYIAVGADAAVPYQLYQVDSRLNFKLNPGENLAYICANNHSTHGAQIQVTSSIYSQLGS